MSTAPTASERITDEVASWPGIEVDRGEIGEVAFKLGRRELGHIHGDAAAHFSFPKSQWRALQQDGRIEHHPVFPDQVGPAQRRIAGDDDVRDVIALFRLIYDRIVDRMGLPAEAA